MVGAFLRCRISAIVRRMRARVADYETLVGDVRDLRAFALTCDLKSLTTAAQVMGESKATTSRRITRLETALGRALLRRSPRAIETTDEGAIYRARVAVVLELLGDANAVAQGARAVPSGQLRVSTPPGLCEALAPVLAQFSAAFPKVAVSVEVGARFVDIEAEQFDVALRAATKLADSSLVAHRVGTVELERIVVAAPSYLKAHPAPRRVEDLASHRILETLAREAAAMHSVVFRLPGNDGHVTTRFPVAMASTDIVLVRDIVVEGAGVGILPRMLVQRHIEDGRLVHLLPGLVAHGLNLYLLHRAGHFVPPKVRAFVDFVKKGLVLVPAKTARRSTPRR
jgi:DNA-binding transcriptional LysR family regulator